MPTGVGKTNLGLSMLLTSKDRGGYISTEDPEDVLGSRILAHESGISSLKIRRKDLTDEEKDRISDALGRLKAKEVGPCFEYVIGGGLPEIIEATNRLAEAGCKFAVLDYLQKVKGVMDDRRSEIGRVLTAYQYACAQKGMVAVMVSQLIRMEPTRAPMIHHLKESGDIENECRLIILGHRDSADEQLLHLRVAKSTFGGAGLRFHYRYDDNGVLRETVRSEPKFEEDF